jgi:SAM-dependent methyltransferase
MPRPRKDQAPSSPVSAPEEFYKTSEGAVRPSFGSDRDRALEFYGELLEFVSRTAPPKAGEPRDVLLDVGCGNGWSTFAFATAGYEAIGIDLNANAFEPPPTDHLTLREASALDLPVADETADVVVSYQCIEHLPDPGRALDEMARACKPGGLICIVGPNLVTPFPPLAYLCRPSSWKGMSYVRRPGLPRHPYGNTLGEILGAGAARSFQMLAKVIRRRPHFTMRQPDTVPPFHADNDACYLCNPSDLIAYFRSRGLRVIRRGKYGRPPLSYLFAGGTWVAARKP